MEKTTDSPQTTERSSTPRVSVILPTLNAADYVRKAIDSILQQTYRNFEILIVDDGSTDETHSIVQSYDDDRIRVFIRDEPDNLAGALNYGIEVANGEFVARQDADDISASDRLARQVAFLDSHPDVALVGTATQMISELGDERGMRHVLERPTIEDLLEKNQFVHGSVMFRKERVLEATGGYDTLFETSEDYDLWLRLANEHPVRNLDAPLYTLRLRQDSVFADDLLPAKLFGRYASRRTAVGGDLDLDEQIRSEGIGVIYQHLSRADRSALHTEVAQELLRYGRRKAAFKEAKRAWKLTPTSFEAVGFAGLSIVPTRVTKAVIWLYRMRINNDIIDTNAAPVSEIGELSDAVDAHQSSDAKTLTDDEPSETARKY